MWIRRSFSILSANRDQDLRSAVQPAHIPSHCTSVVLIKNFIPHPNCLLICQEHMLREVKIHNSALLPKVQFQSWGGKMGRREGREREGEEDGQIFMTDLVLIWSCKLGWYFIEPNVKFYIKPLKRPNSTLKLDNYNYFQEEQQTWILFFAW